MELLNTLYNLMSLVFVLGTMASMGLSLTMAQITGPLRNARFVIVALLANFLVPPILAFLLIQIFSWTSPWRSGCCWSRWRRAPRHCPRRRYLPKSMPPPRRA